MSAAPAAGWSRPVALVVATAFFLETFDATVLVTATPAIARDFGVGAADVGLAMTAYLLAVAVFIPVSGWAADRWGARRVFCAAIVVFVVASLLCALSPGLLSLVLARTLQGVGGSMMVPVGRLIVLRTTDKSELLRVIAYLTWPALVAPVVAPLAGGLITQFLGWPWIFYLNVPLGVALFVVAARLIPKDEARAGRRLDLVGLVGVSSTLVALVLGLELVASADGTLPGAVLLGAAAVVGGLTVRRLVAARAPLLDLSSYRIVSFRVTNSSGVWYRTAVSAVPFLLPLLMQDGFGWSPVAAGAMVMWVFVGNLAVKPLTTWLIGRLGFATVMVWSAVGVALTLIAVATMTADTPILVMAVVLLLSGVFRSTGFTAYGTIQFAEIPPERMNGANTLSATLVQVASGLGVAVAAVVVRLADAAGLGGLAPYRWALVVMAAVACLSAVGAARLPPDIADDVRRRAKSPA